MFIARSEYGMYCRPVCTVAANNLCRPRDQVRLTFHLTSLDDLTNPTAHSRRKDGCSRSNTRSKQSNSVLRPLEYGQRSAIESAVADRGQIATGEGVVLGVEKRVTSTLLETSSVEKILEIDKHIGCAMSGLQADARSMIEHARVESQNHTFHFNEPLRVESCTQAICDLALRFGEGADGEESIMSRPFGVALLIAGIDEDGPQLWV